MSSKLLPVSKESSLLFPSYVERPCLNWSGYNDDIGITQVNDSKTSI